MNSSKKGQKSFISITIITEVNDKQAMVGES